MGPGATTCVRVVFYPQTLPTKHSDMLMQLSGPCQGKTLPSPLPSYYDILHPVKLKFFCTCKCVFWAWHLGRLRFFRSFSPPPQRIRHTVSSWPPGVPTRWVLPRDIMLLCRLDSCVNELSLYWLLPPPPLLNDESPSSARPLATPEAPTVVAMELPYSWCSAVARVTA